MAEALPQLAYQRDAGRGLSRARNLGLARIRSPLVAFTDDDCTVTEGWAGAFAAALAGEIGGAVGRTLPGQRGAAPGLLHAGSTQHADLLARFEYPCSPFTIGSGNNMAFPSRLFAEIGGFDERLGAGTRAQSGEDSELFYRALRAGRTLAYIPDALVYHHSWLDQRTFLRHRYGYFVGAGLFLTSYALRGDRVALRLLLRRLRWECAELAWEGVRRRDGPTLRRALVQSAGSLAGVGAALGQRRGWAGPRR
jgi:GT2 family glycosyltransferase